MIERDKIHLWMVHEVYTESTAIHMMPDVMVSTLFYTLPFDVNDLPRGQIKVIEYVHVVPRYTPTYTANYVLCVLCYIEGA